MRLLSFKDSGGLTQEDFAPSSIPPYAILSQTWGRDEILLQDLDSGHAKEKDGYRKILCCGKQAARDGLHYFWVDTCCIDKRSSAELSEAINSMFCWYRNSTKCYAYLSDVDVSTTTSSAGTHTLTWANAFKRSRWFTRGWTLQELLAPSSVIFYSSQYTRLGDKVSLAKLINEATGIPVSALAGEDLNAFSTAERMSWTRGRQTTRKEDIAYCLFGIFDISAPVIYGEGEKMAMRKLQEEIDKAPVSNRLLLEAHERGGPVAKRFDVSHVSRVRVMEVDSSLSQRSRHLARIKGKHVSLDQYKTSYEGFLALINTQRHPLREPFLRDTTQLLQLLHDGSQNDKFSNSKKILLLDQARILNDAAIAAADTTMASILLSKMRFEAGIRQIDRLVLHCQEAGRDTSRHYLEHQADQAIGTMTQALKGMRTSEDYGLAKEIEQDSRARLRDLLSQYLPTY